MGIQPARQIEALVKAYELRERLPESERYQVEGQYAYRIRGDLLSALSSFRNHAELEQVDAFWATIGSLLIQLGRPEEAEQVLVHALEVSPTPMTYYHLASARFGMRKDSSASDAVASGLVHYPRFPALEQERVELALAHGDFAGADSLVHTFTPRATERFPLVYQAAVDAIRGKPGEALEHLRQLRAARDAAGLYVEALDATLSMARIRLFVMRDTAGAIRLVDEGLARHPLTALDVRERPYVPIAHFYLEAGRPDRVRPLLGEYEAVVPRDYRATDHWLLLRARALLRVASGEVAEGAAELRGTLRGPPSVAPIAELARGYELLGQADSALATYSLYLAPRILNRMSDDALFLAPVLERRAALQDARGDRAGALASYERLLRMWSDAEPSLRARRDEIARRAATLRPH
jgi:tetratricopeptide (TPR) repeat protein